MIVLSNLTNLLFTSNNENVLKISPNDRRFTFFKCSNVYLNDKPHQTWFGAYLERKDVARALYQHLKSRPLAAYPYDFQSSRPITDYYKEAQLASICPVARFISALVNDDQCTVRAAAASLSPKAYTLALPTKFAAALLSIWTGSSPFSNVQMLQPRQGLSLTLGRMASMRWNCCLIAVCIAGRSSTWSVGGGTQAPEDAWVRLEELDYCRDLVAEYDDIAHSTGFKFSPGCSSDSGRRPGSGSGPCSPCCGPGGDPHAGPTGRLAACDARRAGVEPGSVGPAGAIPLAHRRLGAQHGRSAQPGPGLLICGPLRSTVVSRVSRGRFHTQ